MSSFLGIQSQIGRQLAGVALNSLTSSVSSATQITTTATNLLIVVNGITQGLIRSMTVDESYNFRKFPAIGAPVYAAMVPGVYDATATIEHAFLFAETIDIAFGAGIRAVTGKQLTAADPRSLYFNIIEVDAAGNPLSQSHDCVLQSVSRTVDIEQVIILERAQVYIRWST